MSETWSRRLRLLLVISLAVNLFFIGAVAVSGAGHNDIEIGKHAAVALEG